MVQVNSKSKHDYITRWNLSAFEENDRIESTTFHFSYNKLASYELLISSTSVVGKRRLSSANISTENEYRVTHLTCGKSKIRWSIIEVFFFFHPPQLVEKSPQQKRLKRVFQIFIKKKEIKWRDEWANECENRIAISSPMMIFFFFFFKFNDFQLRMSSKYNEQSKTISRKQKENFYFS